MGPFFFDGLRAAVRMPASWALLGLGMLFGFAARALSILAVGEGASQAQDIAVSTSHAFGGIVALWIAATLCAEDLGSAFALAAESTRGGRAGRVFGRAAAACVCGVVVSCILLWVLGGGLAADGVRLLLLATTWVALSMAAWGSLLASGGRAGLAVLGGAVAWFLGHLPWGSPELLPGWAGRGLAAWLPGPHDPSRGLADAGYTLPAAWATVCWAWALTARRESGE